MVAILGPAIHASGLNLWFTKLRKAWTDLLTTSNHPLAHEQVAMDPALILREPEVLDAP